MDKDEARIERILRSQGFQAPSMAVLKAMDILAAEARADQKERDARIAEGQGATEDDAGEYWIALDIAKQIRSQDHD